MASGTRFSYDPPVMCHGAGSVDALGAELRALDCRAALVVTGETVGETAAVMDPVRAGLGERHAGTAAMTTPEKRLSTALSVAREFDSCDADALVAVGGGSSVDLARVVAVLVGRHLDDAAAGAEFAETGTLAVPDGTPPLLVVPTTLSGADQSAMAGLTADPATGPVEERVAGGVGGAALVPSVAVYDPDLFATTPRSVLAGSAMNGFDKGLETLYSRHATPVTDATAARGLGLFADGLTALDGDGLPAAVEGLALVGYGAARGDATTFSVIHALGKFVADAGGVQQGVGHAVVAPATLSTLFADVDGRRDLLAGALGVTDADAPAAAVVDRVEAVRDALDLPTALRDLDGLARGDLARVAERAAGHAFATNGPAGFDPSAAWFERALERAW